MSDAAAGVPVLARLATALREEGGLPAEVVHDPAPDADDRIGRAVAEGPRAATVGPELALAAEATREAELLHHAPEHARVVRTTDRDLALLAGDRLYALGLERLAAGGWTAEVAVLSDVVSLVARLHGPVALAIGPAPEGAEAAGTGDPDDAAARTATLWTAAAAALGGGADSPAAHLLREVREGGVPHSNALTAVSAPSPDGPPDH